MDKLFPKGSFYGIEIVAIPFLETDRIWFVPPTVANILKEMFETVLKDCPSIKINAEREKERER